MSVYVTIVLCQGIVDHARVFRSKKSAINAEKKWLEENAITDNEHREAKSQSGTECIVMSCDLEP